MRGTDWPQALSSLKRVSCAVAQIDACSLACFMVVLWGGGGLGVQIVWGGGEPHETLKAGKS